MENEFSDAEKLASEVIQCQFGSVEKEIGDARQRLMRLERMRDVVKAQSNQCAIAAEQCQSLEKETEELNAYKGQIEKSGQNAYAVNDQVSNEMHMVNERIELIRESRKNHLHEIMKAFRIREDSIMDIRLKGQIRTWEESSALGYICRITSLIANAFQINLPCSVHYKGSYSYMLILSTNERRDLFLTAEGNFDHINKNINLIEEKDEVEKYKKNIQYLDAILVYLCTSIGYNAQNTSHHDPLIMIQKMIQKLIQLYAYVFQGREFNSQVSSRSGGGSIISSTASDDSDDFVLV